MSEPERPTQPPEPSRAALRAQDEREQKYGEEFDTLDQRAIEWLVDDWSGGGNSLYGMLVLAFSQRVRPLGIRGTDAIRQRYIDYRLEHP